MRPTLARAVRTSQSTVQRVARASGYEIGHYRPRGSRRARAIERARVEMVLDVGANIGTYGEELREFGYRGRIMSFEPRLEPYRQLTVQADADPLWTAYNTALGPAQDVARINLAGNGASSSLRPMTQLHVDALPTSRYHGDEEVSVRRLDDFTDGIEGGLMLKLDVQGFEREVLGGAQDTLRRTAIVECELCVRELYTGQALLPELTAFFTDHGLELTALDPEFTDVATGEILAFDGIFHRQP